MRVSVTPFVCAGIVAYGALLAAACDSDKFYPSTGARGFPGSSSTPADAGSTTPREIAPSPCEEAMPTYACEYQGPQACELGDAANVRCNDVLSCVGYRWRPADAGPPCTTACPAAFTFDEPDGACSAETASTLLCEYPEGMCGCARASRLVDASTDADAAGDDPDAGDAGDAGPYVWTCIQAKEQEGCPRTRPRLGARCVRRVTCDYGSCVFDDGIVVECRGSTSESFWSQGTPVGCRLPGQP